MLGNIRPRSVRAAYVVLTLFPISVVTRSSSFVGCYKDSGHSSILNGIHIQNLNPPSFDSSQIFFSCGNNAPSRAGRANEANCDLACQDNVRETCGGYEFTSVFASSVEPVSNPEVPFNTILSNYNTEIGNQNSTSVASSPQKLPPLVGSNSISVTSIPTAFIDNTGLMAAVFTLAGVVLIGCGILGCVLYKRKRRITSYSLTSDENLQTTYLWQRRSSLSLRDDMDYTKKLRITNPDVRH